MNYLLTSKNRTELQQVVTRLCDVGPVKNKIARGKPTHRRGICLLLSRALQGMCRTLYAVCVFFPAWAAFLSV